MSVLALALAFTLLAGPAPTPRCGVERSRAGQQSFIDQGVFAGGRLWLRTDSGQLLSLAEAERATRQEFRGDPVLGVCARRGEVAILTCHEGTEPSWALRTYASGKWSIEREFEPGDDAFVAIACGLETDTLITSRRIITWRAGGVESVTLSAGLPRSLSSSVALAEDWVFVGSNRGEFGGGLRVIERKTGQVRPLEERGDGGLCEGLLNSGCDPVHGLAVEPWNPSCVVAAVGLIHWASSGRLLEACGPSLKALYSRRLDSAAPRGRASKGRAGDADEEVAFFGAVTAAEAVWAVSDDGLYRVGASGVVRSALPAFRNVGGVWVSFRVPGLVLVMTDINARMSLGPGVPLLIPR